MSGGAVAASNNYAYRTVPGTRSYPPLRSNSSVIEQEPARKTKMKFRTKLMAKLFSKLRNAYNEVDGLAEKPMVKATSLDQDYNDGKGLGFTIYNCDGGTLITCVKTDSSRNSHGGFTMNRYVVPQGQNLGEKIEQIISFEAIK